MSASDLCARKTLALTGCTTGIGRAVFEWFCSRGDFNVAGCGTNPDKLAELRASHPAALVCKANLCEQGDVSAWLKEIEVKFGKIDLLICNAGVTPTPAPFQDLSEEDWRSSCEVNILGTARLLRDASSRLRSPGATVVVLSSRYGRSVVKNQAAYCATKWATEGMAKALALEHLENGIVVVPLDPGVVKTSMLRKSCPGPAGEAWCNQQRSPEDFAAEFGPFVLSLGMADTGRSLTCPGSPDSYFQTGVAYKDRPAWANGIGPFVRAVDDAPVLEAAPPPKKQRCAESPRGEAARTERRRRYFISGVMGGSNKKLDTAKDLVPQDYRGRIAQLIKRVDAHADIVDPMFTVWERAQAQGLTIDQLLGSVDDAPIRDAFGEVVTLAAECDVVISNLPEASMGSAVELWEAKKKGRTVLTVSPLAGNWLIRSVTDHNFADLEDLEANLHAHIPGLA